MMLRAAWAAVLVVSALTAACAQAAVMPGRFSEHMPVHLEATTTTTESDPIAVDECKWEEKNGEHDPLGEFIFGLRHGDKVRQRLHDTLMDVSDPKSPRYGVCVCVCASVRAFLVLSFSISLSFHCRMRIVCLLSVLICPSVSGLMRAA